MTRKVIDLVKDDDVRKLADKDTLLAGHALLAKGEVLFGVFRSDHSDPTHTCLIGYTLGAI